MGYLRPVLRISGMAVMLVSTYELGHQPVHIASPAAALRAAGIETVCVDLSVEELDIDSVKAIDAIAFSVPMHTAMRLAVGAARKVKELRPDLPIAFYGLYADVGSELNHGSVVDAIFCGEYEAPMVDWALGSTEPGPVMVSLGKSEFLVPDRRGLPPLETYARLEHQGEARIAAAVEASHGCRHRCKHCPIPAVYDGRLRVVGHDVVLGDIAQVVALGAQHVTFTDADFLNAPAYSLGLLREAHASYPELTFDVTVKVEHILEHRDLWPEMARLGVLFTVSAFETVDDRTLEILAKGHTVSDMSEAVDVMNDAGIHLRPTWLPFVPWTTPQDIASIVRFLDAHDLAPSVDPVQMAIKLLVPEGSLLLSQPEMARHLRHFDAAGLTWVWEFASPETELLQKELDQIAAAASDCKEDTHTTLSAMRRVISSSARVDLGDQPPFDKPVPRLSESWFCCAEPTVGQASVIDSIAIGKRPR